MSEKEAKAAEEEKQTPAEENDDSDEGVFGILSFRANIPKNDHTSSTGSKIPPTFKFTDGGDDTETTPIANDEAEDIEPIWYKEAQRLFKLPCAHGLFQEFQSSVTLSVYNKVSELMIRLDDDEHAFEVQAEIADSIELLRLLGASNLKLNEIAAGARQGAKNLK